MKKLAAIFAITTLLPAGIVHAGAGLNIWDTRVTVDGTVAYGLVTSVHRTGGANEYIYCQTQAFNSGTATTYKVTCEAQSLNGGYLKCERTGTENDNFINVAGMINKTSQINFHRNSQGVCSNIFIQNMSYNLEQSF